MYITKKTRLKEVFTCDERCCKNPKRASKGYQKTGSSEGPRWRELAAQQAAEAGALPTRRKRGRSQRALTQRCPSRRGDTRPPACDCSSSCTAQSNAQFYLLITHVASASVQS